MKESYNQRRNYLVHELRDMGLDCFEPYGAFYVFPSIKKFGLTSEEFATRLLEEEKVAVVPEQLSVIAEKVFLEYHMHIHLMILSLPLAELESSLKDWSRSRL